jgi:CheY-like chemotaxis protein
MAKRGDAAGEGAGGLSDTLQLFSHDIRSAMSDVIGGLRLVDRDRLRPEARLQFERVEAAADTLAALVDGALMAAAGDRLFHQEDRILRLEDWLPALSGRWSGRASTAGGAFVIDCGPNLPKGLLVSQLVLDRIIGNLISNALIHALGAPVRLSLSGQPGTGLMLTVRDGGPGFAPELLDRVADGQEAGPLGPHAGAGLGLRIAARLSREIGGGLTLSNPAKGGGQARLFLPEALLDRNGSARVADPLPDLDGLRILVAEDNLTNQTILRQLLDAMGADAVCVADGVATLEVMDRQVFDIALIDIEMPRLSGLEVMRAVRARDDGVGRMPMVALTAYVLRDNREAIYAAGADGIIGKPISSGADFGRAILRYAGRPSGLPEPEDVLAAGPGAMDLGRKIDRARFDALLAVAGPSGIRELLQRLHEDLGAVLATLDHAVAAGDIPEIRAQTHILIALSGAVGAERLHHLAEVLNIAAKRRRVRDLAALYAPCRADLRALSDLVAAEAAAAGFAIEGLDGARPCAGPRGGTD